MRTCCTTIFLLLALLSPVAVGHVAAQSTSVAPTLIQMSGRFTTPAGDPRTGTTLLVISLYEGQTDTAPRWIEYQQVTLDALGRYDLNFGATRQEGLPGDLFTGDAATRWLGVAIENEPEQPRVQLVSVPYAAKAASADTLAGKPATDFVLTSTFKDDVRAALDEDRTASASGDVSTAATSTGFIPKFTDNSGSHDNSSIFQSAGNIGIGTTGPGTLLHLKEQVGGRGLAMLRLEEEGGGTDHWNIGTNNAGSLAFFAETLQNVTFKANGNVGIGTTSPTAKLHVAGDVVVDGNIGAKYQDIAEWVESVEPLDAGSIVIIRGGNRVAAATRSYDVAVAGAVSAQPGIVLGEAGVGKVLVAQSGRVKIKADARYGAIRPGDLLVSSPTRGHAMRSRAVKMGDQLMHRPGTLIGKALEALPKGRGEILVLLTLQ